MRSYRRPVIIASVVALTVVAFTPTSLAVAPVEPSSIVQHQSVRAELAPTGAVREARVFTDVVVTGDGEVTVSTPGAATKGLRNLEGFSAPRVEDGSVVWTTNVSGAAAQRTVADFDRDLPVTIAVSYTLNGQSVEPDELVGRSGELAATYTLTNLTTRPVDITYESANGDERTEVVDLAVPYVGSVSLELDRRFRNVEAPGAVTVGDGRGATVINWSAVLFEPLGSNSLDLTYTAQVTDAIAPAANIQLSPVDSRSFTSLATTEEAYAGAAEQTGALANGAGQLDANLIKIRDGIGSLLAGMRELSSGAGDLRTGLVEASSGAGRLSAGLEDADAGGKALAGGLLELSAGASGLSVGAAKVDAGTGQLAAGTSDAADGAEEILGGLKLIQGGLAQLADPSAGLPYAQASVTELRAGIDTIIAGIGAPSDGNTILGGLALVGAGLPVAKGGVDQINSQIGPATTPGTALNTLGLLRMATTGQVANLQAAKAELDCAAEPVACGTIDGVVASLQGQTDVGLAGLEAGMGDAQAGLTSISGGLGEAIIGVAKIDTGVQAVAAGLQSGSTANPGIAEGLDLLEDGIGGAVAGVGQLLSGAGQATAGQTALVGGLGELDAGASALAAGTEELAAGSQLLAKGAGDAADGADELSTGLGELSDGGNALHAGLITAADGSGRLATGLVSASSGTVDLSVGASAIREGAATMAGAVNKAANGAILLVEQVRAVDELGRTESLPYGAPEGATSSAIYEFAIAEEAGEAIANVSRFAGAAVLLLAAALLPILMMRRRGPEGMPA